MSNKLLIGCGIHKREGWLTLDPDPSVGADIVGTIPPLPPELLALKFADIEWIHGITSLYPWDAIKALADIFFILEPGGKLVLEQPDFNKAKERVEWLFGDGRLARPLLMNKWAWSPESLQSLLRYTGFVVMSVLPAQYHVPDRDFRVETFKPL